MTTKWSINTCSGCGNEAVLRIQDDGVGYSLISEVCECKTNVHDYHSIEMEDGDALVIWEEEPV